MKKTKKETTLNQKKPRPRAAKADGESAVLAKMAAMPGRSRAMGERLHAVIKANAPVLSPRLWYGMPAYAKDGKVVCFFPRRGEVQGEVHELGLNDAANPDEGHLWPIALALTELTAAEGKDRRPREESGELRTPLSQPLPMR